LVVQENERQSLNSPMNSSRVDDVVGDVDICSRDDEIVNIPNNRESRPSKKTPYVIIKLGKIARKVYNISVSILPGHDENKKKNANQSQLDIVTPNP
jgi:hypothetical protein